MDTFRLWDATPGPCEEIPVIDVYIPENKACRAAVIILPGGSYVSRAPHEGAEYAVFLNSHGITAFVAGYRVSPHTFPLPLLDARRAVRWVRAHAQKYGIDKNQIAVMGSSAGGHLAALTSTYTKPVDFEHMDKIDIENYKPNAQILCYPVIVPPAYGNVAHSASYKRLIGCEDPELEAELDPVRNVTSQTPQAFIWHTAADAGVNVINSYLYATALREHNVPVEMHIFPNGRHGLGLAPSEPHTAQWTSLLLNWLEDIGWNKNEPAKG